MKHTTMTRRRFVATGSAATLTIGLTGPGNAASGEFVSTVFGGAYEKAYRKHVIEPFEQQTGIKVLTKLGLSSEWLTNAMVNRNAPEIDLLLLPYPDNIRATI